LRKWLKSANLKKWRLSEDFLHSTELSRETRFLEN